MVRMRSLMVCALVALGLWGQAFAQQAVDEETPGKHKKVEPPPPPAPAAAVPAAPETAAPATTTTKSKGKKTKKGKKGKAVPAESTATPAPKAPPAEPVQAVPPPPPPPPRLAPPPVAPPPPIMEEHAPPAMVTRERLEESPHAVSYSAGFRVRYISVPGWLLGAFTQNNMPLNSASIAGEFIRRKSNLDIVGSMDLSFMSPSDGNWLGNNHPAATDTDYVQFDGFKVLSFDATFIWHHALAEKWQLEYGAGVGLGIVMGRILRTSDYGGSCATDPGNVQTCHPILCANGPCTEAQLAASMTGAPDGPASPHRFEDSNVPPVIPIVNLLAGIVYQVQERTRMRLEAGFRNAFFLGLASEYQF
jgi:hypothetical protein